MLYTLEEAALIDTLDASKLGGKGFNLKLIASAFVNSQFQPVPNALLCTTDLYKHHVNSIDGLNSQIAYLYRHIGHNEKNDLQLYKDISNKIISKSLSEYCKNKIRTFLKANDNMPVSVRSSATVEDGASASFAGIFDTFLGQSNEDEVFKSLKKCWASLWMPNVYFYLKQLNDGKILTSVKPIMAVVIQVQVDSKASGVMFTLNVNSGGITEFTVESVFGQGEGYVSGSLSADKYLIRRKDGKLLVREIVVKEYYYDIIFNNSHSSSNNNNNANSHNQSNTDSHWVKKQLPDHLKYRSSLTQEQLIILSNYGNKLLDLYNEIPQDIEFAVDAVGYLYLLQSRPVTSVEPNYDAAEAMEFINPGKPGESWKLNEHFIRPHTPLFTNCYESQFAAAIKADIGSYLPDSISDFAPPGKFINGFMYLGDDTEKELNEGWSEEHLSSKLPTIGQLFTNIFFQWTPTLVLQLATKIMFNLVPAAISFKSKCKEVLQNKKWLKDLEFWDNERRPELIKTHNKLSNIDPEALLSSEDLLNYVLDVINHFRFCAFNHHRFNSAAMLPVNFFLRFSSENGLSQIDAYELLEGNLKEQVYEHSAGKYLRSAFLNVKNMDALELLRHAVEISDDTSLSKSDQDKRILLILNKLQNDSNYSIEIRESMKQYLNENWYRQVGGYDITFFSGREMPGILASAAWKIINDDIEMFRLKHDENVKAALEKITRARQEEWLELMEDAHKCHRLRDERSLYSDVWAAGILRRALFTVGKRFLKNRKNDDHKNAQRIILHDINHILFITENELIALLKNESAINDDDSVLLDNLDEKLQYRYVYSMQTLLSHAPSSINGPYKGRTSGVTEFISPIIGDKNVRQIILGLADIAKVSDSNMSLYNDKNIPGVNILHGDSGSKGKYTGKARMIRSAADFMLVQRGEIIFSEFTNSSFTLIMSKAGACVTEVGGTLSHAAIVCRESKVPCVTNCTNAMQIVEDGDMVTVDGDVGRVMIVERNNNHLNGTVVASKL